MNPDPKSPYELPHYPTTKKVSKVTQSVTSNTIEVKVGNHSNPEMAVLRHIHPNMPRKQLRKILKNKAYMKALNIRKNK